MHTMDRRLGVGIPAFLALFSLFFSQSGASTGNSTVYDVLLEHGFPIGLLPRVVVYYDLHLDGRFMVRLKDECAFTLRKTYHVTYDSSVSGLLKYGAITQLSGVSVKVWFFSLSVNGIYVSGNDLLFQVRFVSTKFPATVFKESPICGADLTMLCSA